MVGFFGGQHSTFAKKLAKTLHCPVFCETVIVSQKPQKPMDTLPHEVPVPQTNFFGYFWTAQQFSTKRLVFGGQHHSGFESVLAKGVLLSPKHNLVGGLGASLQHWKRVFVGQCSPVAKTDCVFVTAHRFF